MIIHGTVIAAHGRHYQVDSDDGRHWQAVPRGKRSLYACGDRVALETGSADQGRIAEHLPRTSLLFRSDAYRQKLIAANVDQIVIVTATEPAFSEELISRTLVAAEDQGIRALLVLNKCDLATAVPAARARLAPFAALGYPVLELSARHDPTPLRPWLEQRLSVLIGQSGMGKSTLINHLIPNAQAATREISTALDSGKHTTTHATLYPLAGSGGLIDSPGLQEFGLAHLRFGQIEHGFLEFRPLVGQCRFRDCRHDAEPGCAIRAAVDAGTVDAGRFRHFRAAVAAAG